MQFIGTGDRILTENFNVGYLYTITFKTGIYINSACIGIGDTFVMFQKAEPDLLFTLNVDTADEVDTIELYDSGGGTNNYDDLVNRPQINSHTLTGNMSGSDLGLQDTISDIDTIRAGAAAGATAVQPADMTSALALKQDTISDLDTIRAGAAAGATAVQPADMTTALATKQDALNAAQLNAVNSGITSTDVAQIETNKNNILLLEQMNGAKNLYKFEDLGATAGSGTGVTLTDNGDGTFTATGTASGANYARYLLKQAPIKAGVYIISGISGGALESYRLRVGTGSGDAYIVNLENNYAQFTIATDTTITVQFVVNSGVTVTNLSIKPMIITKAMYDAGFTDYQPYAMSNVELTAEVTPKIGDITLVSAYSSLTYNTKYIVGIGKIVTLQLYIEFPNALTAGQYTEWGSITGVPLPKYLYRGVCVQHDEYYNPPLATCALLIRANGSIGINPPSGFTGKKYIINVSYIGE